MVVVLRGVLCCRGASAKRWAHSRQIILPDTTMDRERRNRGRIRARPSWGGSGVALDRELSAPAQQPQTTTAVRRNCSLCCANVLHVGSDFAGAGLRPASGMGAPPSWTDDASVPGIGIRFGANRGREAIRPRDRCGGGLGGSSCSPTESAARGSAAHARTSASAAHLKVGGTRTSSGRRPSAASAAVVRGFVFAAVAVLLLDPVRTSATPVRTAPVAQTPPAVLATPPAADALFARDVIGEAIGRRSAEAAGGGTAGGIGRRLTSEVCPTCPNLARSCSGASADPTLGAPACITDQSSKITTNPGGHSRLAVDGSTNQVFADGSVTHTVGASSGWWEVTLEAQHNKMEEIVIYGRSDCCYSRLLDIKVEVIDHYGTTVHTLFGPSTLPLSPSPADLIFQFDLTSDGIVGKTVKVSNVNDANESLSLAEVEVYGTPLVDLASEVIGETGQIILDNTIDGIEGYEVVVPFRKLGGYDDPVVVVFINTYNGGESVAPRVRNVTATSFHVFSEEADDQGHNKEIVSYLVMERGRYELDGGWTVEAGTLLATAANVHLDGSFANLGVPVNFTEPFPNGAKPALFHTLNTYENARFMTSFATALTPSGFELGQEASSLSSESLAKNETIGWIAISVGSGDNNGQPVSVGTVDTGDDYTKAGHVVNDPHFFISYPVSFSAIPDVVVSVISSNETEGSYARGADKCSSLSSSIITGCIGYTTTVQSVYGELGRPTQADSQGRSDRGYTSTFDPLAWAAFQHESDLLGVRVSSMPSAVPSLAPSAQPSRSPSSVPSASPSMVPSSRPSSRPSLLPSSAPSAGPSVLSSASPSLSPSDGPSSRPSVVPSSVPTISSAPSSAPTALDSDNDGVPDSLDQCRYEGGHVDASGCPIDADDDGIADCISNLHHTLSGCDFAPQSATFNSACCNIELDRCPNTTVVEKDLAAEADGKMTLYTTGTNAGCAILNATAWDSVFLDVVTNSSSILSDPGLEAVFAVDATMISAQESRVGAGFGASSVARFSVLDPSCTRKYDDITQSGDELFTITMYLNDLSQSFFTGQIPEGTVPLSAYIDFNPDLITQSPLWELEYPFSIGTVDCCIRLELLSKDGDVQATHEVVSLTRYNMNQGFAVIDSEMADVVREQASEAISWIDVHYPLKACQCDFFDYCIDNDPTSPDFNGGSLGQGDELKICIFFDGTNGLPEPYVKIADIKTFTCNKEGTSLIHMPISDNRYANGDGVTSVKINNGDAMDAKGRLAKVGTILPPAFFDREPGTAACEGIVQYDFLQNDNIFSRRRQRVLIEALPPAPSSRLPGGSAKSVFNVEIGLAAAWQGPETGAGTSTIRFGRGFLYGIMIMFASVAMLLVARPGSYRACWYRLPCSKYEVKIEKDGVVLTKTTGFSTAVEDSEPPVAHIFVHEEYDEQDETYTQMSCSQFGHNSLSAIETGSSTMLPPMGPDRRAKKRRNNSLDFFKSKLQSDDAFRAKASYESSRSAHLRID